MGSGTIFLNGREFVFGKVNKGNFLTGQLKKAGAFCFLQIETSPYGSQARLPAMHKGGFKAGPTIVHDVVVGQGSQAKTSLHQNLGSSGIGLQGGTNFREPA